MVLKIVSRYHIQCKECGEFSPYHTDKKTELKDTNKSLNESKDLSFLMAYDKKGVCIPCKSKRGELV